MPFSNGSEVPDNSLKTLIVLWLTENPLRVDVNAVNCLTVTGKVINMSNVYETDHSFFT